MSTESHHQQGRGDGSQPPQHGSDAIQQEEQSNYEVTWEAMKMHRDHPLRMKLLWDEIYLAEEIKAKIKSRPELDLPSDFMCVQLALTCKEDIDLALRQVEALQDFRKLYGFVESYQDGCRAIRRMLEVFPGSCLASQLNTADGSHMLVFDISKWDPGNTDPSSIRDFLFGFYYILHAAFPDFHSINVGVTGMVECMAMNWTSRTALKVFSRLTKELPPIYPHNVSSANHYNTPAVFNVIARAANKLLPEEAGQKFQYGLKYQDGLASIYMVPDVATAQQRLIQQLEENLKLRFDNEKKFSLDRSNCEPFTPSSDDEVDAVCQARGLPF